MVKNKEIMGMTDGELEAEIKRRKEIKDSPPPDAKTEMDFSPLILTIKTGVAMMVEKQWEDEDFKQYVYEAALEAVYGKEYWAWRNAKKW